MSEVITEREVSAALESARAMFESEAARYSNGHEVARMEDEVYGLIKEARGKGLPWPRILDVLQRNGLTQYKMHESLSRAWRDEKRMRGEG